MRERLEQVGAEIGWPLSSSAIDRLMTLRGLWRSQGRAINLTAADSDDALLAHLGDGIATVLCASRVRGFDDTTWWLDVGSGGGFPGLVVAAIAQTRMTLVEPRQRRAAFLEFALASIGHDSEVIRARIGEKTWDNYLSEREIDAEFMPFSIASSRAVFAPEIWLGVADNLVMEGGVVIAHLRPGQDDVGGRPPTEAVEWGSSRIAAFRRRRGERST